MDLSTTSRWSKHFGRVKAPRPTTGYRAPGNVPNVSIDAMGFDPYRWEHYSLSSGFEDWMLNAGPEALLLNMEQLDPLDVLALWADMNG